jgi:hypothetical protein
MERVMKDAVHKDKKTRASKAAFPVFAALAMAVAFLSLIVAEAPFLSFGAEQNASTSQGALGAISPGALALRSSQSFGTSSTTACAIEDSLWADDDGDGTRDEEEYPAAGFTVPLNPARG